MLSPVAHAPRLLVAPVHTLPRITHSGTKISQIKIKNAGRSFRAACAVHARPVNRAPIRHSDRENKTLMAPPLLTLRDVHLTFGGTPLLTGAELSVPKVSACALSAATAPASRPF